MAKSKIKIIVFLAFLLFIIPTLSSLFQHKKVVTHNSLIQKSSFKGKDFEEIKDPEKFTFTFAGDYGANSNTLKVLETIEKIKPSFHLALGDFSYNEVTPEVTWCNFVKNNTKVPFLLLSGNHESGGDEDDGLIENFKKCLPYSLDTSFSGEYARNYYFDYPKENPILRTILISPDLDFNDGTRNDYLKSEKIFFDLKKQIQEAKEKGINWIVVGMHKVCITTDGKWCEIGESLPNLLIEEGVSLVVSGHSHLYERSYMLKCMVSGKFEESCISSKDSELKKDKGTVFVTAGTGGIKARPSNKSDEEVNYFSKIIDSKDENHFGVVKVSVYKNNLNVAFIDILGNTRDSFKITK